MPQYLVELTGNEESGNAPQLKLERENQIVFQMPIVAGLASESNEEKLSEITYSLNKSSGGSYELSATAKSSLWTGRRFKWRFFPDHIEFQQFATGSGKLGRCYFLANGVSNRWDNGTTPGHAWDATIYADRYFAPNPNHANQFEFSIAMPQILGFSVGREESSEADFRPERMTGLFAPPPLFLAFHLDKTWTGVGIGAKPYRSTRSFNRCGSRAVASRRSPDARTASAISRPKPLALPVTNHTLDISNLRLENVVFVDLLKECVVAGAAELLLLSICS